MCVYYTGQNRISTKGNIIMHNDQNIIHLLPHGCARDFVMQSTN